MPKKDVPSCLKSIYKILKKDGLVFIKLQEGEPAEIARPEPFDPKLTLDLNVMSKQEISELLESTGFEIKKLYSEYKEPDDDLSDLKELCIIAKTKKKR